MLRSGMANVVHGGVLVRCLPFSGSRRSTLMASASSCFFA